MLAHMASSYNLARMKNPTVEISTVIQMTYVEESFEVMFVPEEEIQQLN